MTRITECVTHQGEPLNLEGVRATGEVRGRMLEMSIEQRFRNPEDLNVEVTYTFPLPWGAVLMGIDVTLNGEKLHGMVAAKQDAREQYEQALSEGNSGILLSRNRDQSYTLELGNLLQGERCVVVLRYAQLLQPEQGSLRLMLPTTIAPRYGDAVLEGGFEPHAAPVSSESVEYPFDINLKFFGALAQARVSSPSHALASQHADGALNVRLALSSWLDRDFVVVLDDLTQSSMGIAAVDQIEPGTSTVLASFSPVLEAATARPLALKVLVDCSGSMNGDSIEAARRALAQFVDGLTPEDRFSLSRFGSTVEHRCKALWVGAGPAKAAAKRWVENLKADLGGTEMTRALKSTMALPSSQACDLLLVTDGEIHGIDDLLATATAAGHRIFVVGIGASPAETHLRRLATATGGTCEFVAPGEAVEPAVLRMFHRLRSPDVTGLRIEWPSESALMEVSPLPASVFDGDSVTVFGRLQASQNPVTEAPIRLFGKYKSQQEEIVLAELTFLSIEDPSNTLSRLWANARYETFANADDSVEAVDQRGTLAERYQLVTDHTNFVLVHERAADEKPEDMPELRQVKSMMAAGWGGLGQVHTRDKATTGALDIKFSLAGPSYDSMSTPSLFRTVRSAPPAAVLMDDLDIPPFLLRQFDSEPVQQPLEVDRSNPDWWADGTVAEQCDPELPGTEKSLNVWNDGYQGLTPAGLREFLRITPKKNWPRKYGRLVEWGLGHEVAEWLEFVAGLGLREAQVVRAFLDLVFEIDFSDDPDAHAAGRSSSEDPPNSEAVPASSALVEFLAQSLVDAQPRRWPEKIIHFAEANFAK